MRPAAAAAGALGKLEPLRTCLLAPPRRPVAVLMPQLVVLLVVVLLDSLEAAAAAAAAAAAPKPHIVFVLTDGGAFPPTYHQLCQ